MSFQSELADAFSEMLDVFGVDQAEEELTLTHAGEEIRCFQGDTTEASALIPGGIIPQNAIILHAPRADFATRPKTGELITYAGGSYSISSVVGAEDDPELRLVCVQATRRKV